MKLIPKAKPVRIRISSGGEEHYSLASLQRKFVWKDIVSLLDGQLVKWLRRINEDVVAEKIEALEMSKYDVLDIYNALFRKEVPFNNMEEVFEEAIRDSSIVPLAKEMLVNLGASQLLELASTYESRLPVFSNQLIALAPVYEKNQAYADLFKIGHYLFNQPNHKVVGGAYIDIAAKHDVAEAIEFAKENMPNSIFKFNGKQVTIDEFKKAFESGWVQNALKKSWDERKYITNYRGDNQAEYAIYEFSNTCLQLHRYIGSAELLPLMDKVLDVKDSQELFARQKIFLHALLTPYEGRARELLASISNRYTPAKDVLIKGAFVIHASLGDGAPKTRRFCLKDPRAVKANLKFFVRYMLDMYV